MLTTEDWLPDLECNKEKPDDQFKPYGATPGHGLEWARLITQWAISTYQEDVRANDYVAIAENLYNTAVADASFRTVILSTSLGSIL